MTPDTSSGLSPELQQIANQAYFLRGKGIGAYAQIEFVLADMCLQFWEWPAYRHLKVQFPINAAARVEAVTVLFKANGPLAKYWKDLEPLLAQLKSYVRKESPSVCARTFDANKCQQNSIRALSATHGSLIDPPTHSLHNLMGAWGSARRLFEECGGVLTEETLGQCALIGRQAYRRQR